MKAPDRVPIVLQQASSDCGVACLSSVISFFRGHQTLEQLRVLSGTAIQGTTVLGLMESAKAVGMDADAFRVDSINRLDTLDGPAILHVVMEEKFSHYIVCYGLEAGGYLVMDPANGKKILSAELLDRIWQSKSLVLAKPNSAFQLKSDYLAKKKKWVFELVKEDLPILLISGFLGLVVTILGLSVAIFSQKLIDEILPDKQWEKLILGLVLLAILLVGRSVLGYLRSTVLIRQSKELNLRLISRFFEQLIYLPKRFFDSRKVGDITARMNDSRRIQRAVSVLTTELMVDSFVVLVTLISVLLYSEVIGLLVTGFLPVYFWLIYSYHHPIRLGQQQLMIHYGSSESSFIDTLTGIGTIKGAGREEDFLKKNQSVYHDFQDQAFRLGQISNRLGLVSQLAGVLFLVSVLGASCYLVATEQMELGVLVAISGMLGMLVPAVNKLALSNLQIQEAKVVGEEGINLSGGQKQLIGLARALIQEPKLLLLDEFTGAMDRNTEQMMLDLILKVKESISILIVTHRVKPALVADEVLILENGKLVDIGSPAELLDRENLLAQSVRDLSGVK